MVRYRTHDISDERLARNVQEGRFVDECFAELHRRWNGQLFAHFRYRGFPLEECLDLTQVVWTRVFTFIEQFHGENFKSWLFKIADSTRKNKIRNLKAQKRQATMVEIDSSDETDRPVEILDPRPLPSVHLLQGEQLEALHKAIKKLSPRKRQCVLLRVQGHKTWEIAVLLKITEGAVKAHLHQARKQLAEELGPLFGGVGF